MKQDNYISFGIVSGFFVGLVIGMIKFSSPEFILFTTIVSCVVFYLIALSCAAFYMKFINYDENKINIKKLDSTLDYYLNELDKGEEATIGIRNYLKHNINSVKEE